MNHLAHLYLSRHSEKMMVGNFIADAIKGKRYADFEAEIAQGIIMHRAIDTFTDSHHIVSHSKIYFRVQYGLYSPVLVDLFYDHFLAREWNAYSAMPLADFSAYSYHIFEKYFNVMPSRYQYMFPYMQKEDWLSNYRHLEGIQRSLTGLSRRIRNNPGIENALTELKQNYSAIESDFNQYFPQLVKHIADGFPE